MLVIRRRAGQSVVIGGGVEIEILEVGANKVKLGISGPRSVPVGRKEVGAAAAANRSAGTLSMDLRELIVKRVAQMAQGRDGGADKNSESGYPGHPQSKENPDPA